MRALKAIPFVVAIATMIVATVAQGAEPVKIARHM